MLDLGTARLSVQSVIRVHTLLTAVYTHSHVIGNITISYVSPKSNVRQQMMVVTPMTSEIRASQKARLIGAAGIGVTTGDTSISWWSNQPATSLITLLCP